jgi:uncharacterized membrane protein (DUF485 family)
MVSAFNLIGIAGLRCFAIYNPRETKDKTFQYCCKIIPMMGWVSALILFLPTLARQYGRFGLKCNVLVCGMVAVDTEENPISPGPSAIYLMIIALSGIVLLFLNILSYVQVYKQSKKIFDQIKNAALDEARKVLQNEKRLQKMVGLVTIAFFLVYMPIILLYAFSGSHMENPMLSVLCQFCGHLLVVIDPAVYIYSSEKYRNGIKLILNPIFSRISTLKRKANHTSEKEEHSHN